MPRVVRNWHFGFEVWAMAYQHIYPGGMVPHYNIQTGDGPIQHVYYNANGQLEIVGHGGRPTGF